MTDREQDDMGDDEQRSEIELTERYVEDPPQEDPVAAVDDGVLGIDEYLAGERKPGEPNDEPLRDWYDETATDESAFHVVEDESDEQQ